MSTPIVWSIAGSDSSGGAGIQADLHTFQDYGVQGCTVITASTAQNADGILHIEALSTHHLEAQLQALQKGMPSAAIKIGMLYQAESVKVVSQAIQQLNVPIIADPVLKSTSGSTLHKK